MVLSSFPGLKRVVAGRYAPPDKSSLSQYNIAARKGERKLLMSPYYEVSTEGINCRGGSEGEIERQ